MSIDLKRLPAEEFLNVLGIKFDVLMENAPTLRKNQRVLIVRTAACTVTLSEALRLFKKEYVSNMASSSIETYDGFFDKYEEFQNAQWDEENISDRVISKVNKAHIETFLNQGHGRKGTKQSNTNYNKKLAMLNAFWRKFIVEIKELLPKPPTVGIERKDEGEKNIQFLSKTELSEIFAKALNNREKTIGKRNYMIIFLAINTGLRLNEIVCLNLSDIDLERERINVTHGTKRNKPRVVPLTKEGIERLQWYINTVRNNVNDKLGNDPLFQNLKGNNAHNRIGRQATVRMVIRLFRSCGITAGATHRLRHTFAITALESGMNIAEIQFLLGHKSIVTTMNYLRLCNEQILKKIKENFPLAFVSLKNLPDQVGGKLGQRLRSALKGVGEHVS